MVGEREAVVNLETLLKVILRNAWLIILSVIITAGSATYVVLRQSPVYQATTTVLLAPSATLIEPRDIIDAQNALERRTLINTLASQVSTRSMQEQVAAILNLAPIKDSDLWGQVVADTNLIEIRARSTDGNLAATISNTAAEELAKKVPLRMLAMDIVERAAAPPTPIEPQPVRVITLALLFGLAVGLGFAMLRHAIQTKDLLGFTAFAGTGRNTKSSLVRPVELDGEEQSTQTPPVFTP